MEGIRVVETNIVSITNIFFCFPLFSVSVQLLIYVLSWIYFEIEESSKFIAEKLCKYLEEHGILVMSESSSRFVLSHKKQLRFMNSFHFVSLFQNMLFHIIYIYFL
jgi:hypothetical protein